MRVGAYTERRITMGSRGSPFAFAASARVAQLDRASASGAEGHRFESCRAHSRLFGTGRRISAGGLVGHPLFFSGPWSTLCHRSGRARRPPTSSRSPMPRSSSTWRDLIPGLAALAGIVAAAVAVLLFARIGQLRGKTYELWAPTSRARGVMKHSEVWLEGQKVGVVRDVHFRDATADTSERLVIHLEVLTRYRDQIRRDSYAQVRPGGSILGSPVVFVSSGSVGATPLRDGDTLAMLPQGDTEGMTSQVALASREFPRIIENVK